MIATGITIPNTVLRKLTLSVAEIHRMTANMTVAELRKCPRERSGANLLCFFRVEFTKTGAIKGFDARPIDRSTEKFRRNGFEADVLILGRVEHAAKELAGACGEYLIRQIVKKRRQTGERELVKLSNEQLADAASELEDLKCRLALSRNDCGTLSEKLKLHLIEHELEVRADESGHQRLQAIAANAQFLARTKRCLEIEAEKAMTWCSVDRAGSFFSWRADHYFPKRSELDQKVISFRADTGWDV